MASIEIAILTVLFSLGLGAFIHFSQKKESGKGYIATATTSGLVTVWLGFIGFLKLGPIQAIISLALRGSPEVAAKIINPSISEMVILTITAIVLSILIYRNGIAAISNDLVPFNSSSMEYFELDREPKILKMSAAHIMYIFKGKNDPAITNPGEDPYKLPDLPVPSSWAKLSADLICQWNTNIERESFAFIAEKNLYKLTQSDPLSNDKDKIVIISPLGDGLDDQEIINSFDLSSFSYIRDEKYRFIACINSTDSLDYLIERDGDILIHVISEARLIEYGLDLTIYATSIINRFAKRFIPGTEYSTEDCFVKPKVYLSDENKNNNIYKDNITIDLIDHISNWSKLDGMSHLSLIGEFGQGKSTALLAYCFVWAKKWIRGVREGRVPLLIELRGKSPKRQSSEAFLGEWGQRYRLTGDSLLNLVRTGKTILIFEGFDEIQEAGLRYERFQQFKSLWRLSFPGGKIIFTGRPNFFLDTKEMVQLLRNGVTEQSSSLQSSKIYILCFMDRDGIKSALRKISPEMRDEILAQCDKDLSFFDIARRPSMLPVIASQWSKIREDILSERGVTSSTIIRGFIDYIYARKESDVDNLGEFQLLERRELRHYFMQRVAWRMASDGLKNTIDSTLFQSEINAAYNDIDAEFRACDGNEIVSSSIRALRVKFKNRPKSELLIAIATDVRTYGLLSNDPAGGAGNLYFPHKQYLEYLIGETMWRKFDSSFPGWSKEIRKRSLLRSLKIEPISIFFASGLWDKTRLNNLSDKLNIIKFHHYVLGLIYTPFMIINAIVKIFERIIPIIVFRRRGIIHNYIKMQLSIISMTMSCAPQHRVLVYNYLTNNINKSKRILFTIPLLLTGLLFLVGINQSANKNLPMLIKYSLNMFENDNDVSKFLTMEFNAIMLTCFFVFISNIIGSIGSNFNLRFCAFAMEIYRFGEIRSIISDSPTSYNLIIKAIYETLPRGSLVFRDANGSLLIDNSAND